MVNLCFGRGLKAIGKGCLLGCLLLAGLYGNICVHELGHFIVADHFGLNPHVKLFDNGSGTGFSFTNQNFYVSYSGKATAGEDFAIAFAGPLTNLLIAAIALMAYMRIPRARRGLRLAVLMLLIPAVLAVFANMLPIIGTDGGTIWGL